ncbi:uncharacterized protein [Periplaneta americana]|uniref:uncharacterized protein n=1 Tax=Periplaneta americana TaxID=6978 RepID=UPI0037E8BA92
MLKLSVFVILVAFAICFFSLPQIHGVEGATEPSTSPIDGGFGDIISVITKFPSVVLQLPLRILEFIFGILGNLFVGMSKGFGKLAGSDGPAITIPAISFPS